MKQALDYLESQLSPEEKEQYAQWRHDDAGCDLIDFMPEGTDPRLAGALQDVYAASKLLPIYKKGYESIAAIRDALAAKYILS